MEAVNQVRILAVEDDDRIRTSLRLALEDEGYEVQEADSGEAAIELHEREAPDLVLVDLMLPGMTGFEVVRALRRTSDVPIVIVTARVDSHDVVAGLEAGADDYVRKPFVVKELAARIRALLRRTRPSDAAGAASAAGEAAGEPAYVFGPLEVRPDEGVVRRDGRQVELTRTEFHLLCEMAENAGLVLSREKLLERVWGYDYFGDARLVDAHIRRLRTKIEDDPSHPTLIVTVRGLGYKLHR
jgi:DNA-binding response OmpR family regulator